MKLTDRNAEIVKMWDADVHMGQIEARFALSHQRISVIVRRCGGKAKRATWAPARAKIEAHRAKLEEAIARHQPLWCLAGELRVNVNTLAKYGFHGQGHCTDPEISAEWERLYVQELLTTGEIAKRLGCAQSTVHTYLHRRGLLRDAAESQRLMYERRKQARAAALAAQIDEWARMLVDESVSVLEISRRSGHPCSRIKRHLRERGIDTSRNRNRPTRAVVACDEVASV